MSGGIATPHHYRHHERQFHNADEVHPEMCMGEHLARLDTFCARAFAIFVLTESNRYLQ